MEQDIRQLFNTEADTPLPLNHRAEFQNKLKQATKKKRTTLHWFYKYAAIILLFLAVGYMFIRPTLETEVTQETALQLQLKDVEQQYLAHIAEEWERFKSLTNDERLISRYAQQLDALQADYQVLSVQFQEDANNIVIIEKLISNLQTRLQFLKDIQHHIKTLHKEIPRHENTL